MCYKCTVKKVINIVNKYFLNIAYLYKFSCSSSTKWMKLKNLKPSPACKLGGIDKFWIDNKNLVVVLNIKTIFYHENNIRMPLFKIYMDQHQHKTLRFNWQFIEFKISETIHEVRTL